MVARRADAELVEAVRGGSQEAFEELYLRYRDAVFGVAFHRVGDFEEARDVVQEAFVKAYLGLAELRDPAAFARWLCRIADGTAIDAARRPRREQALTGEEPAPDRSAEAELAREVREIISRLSEPARLAVVLHYVNGYSHAEVASFLGTTPAAVKMRLSRARSQLREEMTEMAGERIHRAARSRRTRHYSYVAKDREGRVVSGTSEAESKAVLVRRLREKGYVVQRFEPGRVEATPDTGDAIARIAAVILEQARNDKATAIRIELGDSPSTGRTEGEPARSRVAVWYLIGDAWHEVMHVPGYIWPPLRERFAELAGVVLRPEEEQSGRLEFAFEGQTYAAGVTFAEAQMRIVWE